MTGDEVIELARFYYGEETANVVGEEEAKSLLNAALLEMYEDLPTARLKHLISEDSVSLTSGRTDVMDTWDKVLEVYVEGAPAFPVSREIIHNTRYGQENLFTGVVPYFYADDHQLWVVPEDSTDVDVVYLSPPTLINQFTEEVDAFPEQFHPALASLVAAYMYAHEEDAAQAQHYRNDYQQRLVSMTQPTGEEESS